MICVEEGRWRGEIREEEERGRGREEVEVRGQEELHGVADGVGGIDVLVQYDDEKAGSDRDTGKKMTKWTSTVTEINSPAPAASPLPALTTSAPALPPASSMWSRWISRTPSPSPKPGSVIYTPTTTPEPYSDLSGAGAEERNLAVYGLLPEQNGSLAATSLSADADSQERWNGVVVGVARDASGRNAKGMQRILDWDSAVGRGIS